MEIERETVVQVVVSTFAIALFIAALAGLSLTFGTNAVIENKSVAGNVSGDLQEFDRTDGNFEGTLDGHYSNSFEADMTGDVSGTVSDGVASGTFEGNVSGAVEGTARGDINGTVENQSFQGTFNGTINGTDHDKSISPQGGLALVGLIALFILAMPFFGYIIERQSSGE